MAYIAWDQKQTISLSLFTLKLSSGGRGCDDKLVEKDITHITYNKDFTIQKKKKRPIPIYNINI